MYLLRYGNHSVLAQMRFAVLLLLLGASALQAAVFRIELPVLVDNVPAGMIEVGIEGSRLDFIVTDSWSVIAKEHFSPELAQATTQLDNAGIISVKELESAGINVAYDPRTLQILINPLEEQRKTRNVSTRDWGSGPEEVPQTRFASYVNARYVQDYIMESQSRDTGRRDFTVFLDGAVNVNGNRLPVLEWEALYEEGAASRWRRGETRLVYDHLPSASRFSAGDIRYTSRQFQAAPPLLGVSAERQYSTIQPGRIVSSAGQQSFVLSSPATVMIYINNFLQSRQRLMPGRYNIDEFSPSPGLNDVRIVIEDDAGRIEVINYSLFLDSTLLREGISEYSVNAGFQRADEFSERIRYDTSRPAWSGFYRHGLTPGLTAGFQYQGDEDLSLFGVEAVVGTSDYGSLSSVYAESSHAEFGNGAAVNLSWSYERDFFSTGRLTYLNLSSLYTGADFVTLGQREANNPFKWQNRMQVSTSFANDLYTSFSVNYSTRHRSSVQERGFSASLSKRFGLASVNLRVERTLGLEEGTRAFLSIAFPLGANLRSRSTYDTNRDRLQTEISSFSRNTVGDFSGYLAAERSIDDTRLNGDLTYHGNRFIARGQHSYITTPGGASGSEQVVRLQAETAFVNVGNVFAFGRPVSNSFALVRRHESLSGTQINVNETRDGPLAVADAFGPAVLSTLESYRPYRISWRPEAPPAGYDLRDTERLLKPYHRSAFLFTVGSSASVVAMGVAYDSGNNPLPLVLGYIRSLSNTEFPEVKTFTNRSGRFIAQGLEPGNYTVEFVSGQTYLFSIPEGAVGHVDLGMLRSPE